MKHKHQTFASISVEQIGQIPKKFKEKIPRKYKFIEDFRDRYKNSEIWILGCGPSLDDYPENFFDDKISIGIKWSGVAFPNCTFLMAYLHISAEIRYFLIKNPNFIKKGLFLFKEGQESRDDWLGGYINDPVYIQCGFWQTCRRKSVRVATDEARDEFFEAINYIKNGKSYFYPTIETMCHWAIQAAAILGAQKITLAGEEDRCKPNGCHAKRVWHYYRDTWMRKKPRINVPQGGYSKEQMEALWQARYWNRRATRWLAEALKMYEVEVALYHYKDSEQYKAGYLKITEGPGKEIN